VGCGARVEVAKEKTLEKIDSLLGSMDVKRKEVELSMRGLNDGVDGLRKAKIKAKVKRDQIQRQIDPIQEKIDATDKTLTKLRDLLAANEPAEVGGKQYSPEELKEMTAKVINGRKEFVGQRDALTKSLESLDKVVDSLDRKQQEYQQKHTQLENQIAEIDSKTVALTAMKDASASMGDSSAALAENVSDLEDKVNDLFADVETEMITEDEKWNEATANSEIDAVDEFISATQGSGDLLTEIDAILGATK